MAHQQTDLARESVGKLLFRLAVPAIAAQIINALYNIVDRIYIGHIEEVGKIALTGVGVTFPIIMIVSAFAALVGMGGAPLASISAGEGKHEKSERILGNSFVMLLAFAALLTALFLAFREPMLLAFGASEATLPYALDYITIYLCGTIFVQFALGLNAFISAQGFALTGMLTVLIGAVVNIALDPILIFGFGMGVKGAAYATIFSQALSAVWVLIFLSGKRTGWRLHFSRMRPHPKLMLSILALGVAPFIMQSTESLLSIVFNASLQHYGGDPAVGAMTIITSVMQFLLMPLMGLTQGAQPIISFNFGAKNYDRVRAAFRLLLRCCLCFTVVLCAAIELFPQIFILLFNNDPELLDITSTGLRIYMAGTFVFGAQIACQQTFLALGQAKISMFLALLRKIVLLIPLALLLPRIGGLGSTGVFLAEPIADILAVTTTCLMFWRFSKKLFSSPDEVRAVGE